MKTATLALAPLMTIGACTYAGQAEPERGDPNQDRAVYAIRNDRSDRSWEERTLNTERMAMAEAEKRCQQDARRVVVLHKVWQAQNELLMTYRCEI